MTYCGHDDVHVFVDHMVKLEDEITRVLCNPKPMELSEGETNDDRVELEILTDPDMHLFVEKGLEGGIAMISKRYAKANNQYLNDYDPAQPSNYLMYLDANNLYGWAMSQSLPTYDLCWLGAEERETLEVN